MKYKIFVVSDGTGRTAKQIVNAALTQFSNVESDIILYSIVRDHKKINDIIDEVKQYDNSLIAHTIVDINMRKYLMSKCVVENIKSVDLIGQVIDKMSMIFSEDPSQTQGLYYQTNQEYFRRIDAVQFAFKYDDGARIDDIDKAEIILLGVSRTFKTPLSIYLAYNGFFVANIPIIKGIQPPNLNHINPSKVFCLTTEPSKLSELRKSRNKSFGGYANDYVDVKSIGEEISYANRFYSSHPGWRIINVTNKPIEEIASEILKMSDVPFSKHF